MAKSLLLKDRRGKYAANAVVMVAVALLAGIGAGPRFNSINFALPTSTLTVTVTNARNFSGQQHSRINITAPDWSGPNFSPNARAYPTMAYDAATRRVVLFGGLNGDPLGDTWTYNGTTWTQQPTPTSPPSRWLSSMVYDKATRQIVLFGGTSTTKLPTVLGDTWTYNGNTWTQQPTPTNPPGRESATMAYDDATGQVVLFGGYNGGYLGDTWTYNGTTWTKQSTPTSPPARLWSSMAYDKTTRQIVLFGGYNGGFLGDTWTYNGTTWTQQSTPTSPPPRDLSSIAYDTTTSLVVLFGGFDGTSDLADTWTYNGAAWTREEPAHSPPSRTAPGMVWDQARREIVLFGGFLTSPSSMAETWTYS